MVAVQATVGFGRRLTCCPLSIVFLPFSLAICGVGRGVLVVRKCFFLMSRRPFIRED